METDNDICTEDSVNASTDIPNQPMIEHCSELALITKEAIMPDSRNQTLTFHLSDSAPGSSKNDDASVPRKRNVVPDLNTLCFPMIHAASLRPINLSQPLPVSRIGAEPSYSHMAESADGEKQTLVWDQFRTTNYGSVTSQSRHRLRMARKQIFYKYGLQRHWCEERKLIAAVMNSDTPEVVNLLENGANPNVCDQKQRTPLHISASRGQDAIARLLLAKRADPNRQDVLGNTPLHLAVCRGDRATVRVLLENGANMFLKDNAGRAAVSLVRSRVGTLKRDQGLTTDKMATELMMASQFINIYMKRKNEPSTSMDDLCQMMQGVSTQEQTDGIVDVVFKKMSDMSIESNKDSKPDMSIDSLLPSKPIKLTQSMQISSPDTPVESIQASISSKSLHAFHIIL